MKSQHSICLLLSLFLSAAFPLAAHADEEMLDLSILVEPGGSYSSVSGVDFDIGYGLGLGWRFGERWGTEVRAIRSEGTFVDGTTVQLGLRRVLGDSRDWRPFVIFGGHLEDRDFTCGRAEDLCLSPPPSTDVGVFAGGGVDWQFSERSAVRFDGRASAVDTGRGGVDGDLDVTVGYAFRF